jgi:WD40 repeat protein
VGCRYTSLPDTSPSPNLSAPTLAAASLELKAEKQSAHSGIIWFVGFSPDGKTIVSGSNDKTLKVWAARPFDASEWEEVDISGME